ncbi:MAG TPA: AAA family ATPase [Longimicrobium sp.]|jgi:chromosome partitioning protein
MKVVAVINYKGGVGKTTTTANLGAELAWRGYNVLMIDMDPQASLTFSFVSPEAWQAELADALTVKSWFDSFGKKEVRALPELIVVPQKVKNRLVGKGNLHLIASHLGLINVDLELATELGGGTLKQNKINYLRVHNRLKEGLSQLSADRYDLVLIDCPPNFNVVTKTAIVASDSILIPAKPDYLSTLGIDYLRRNVDQLVADFNEYVQLDPDEAAVPINPAILGVVFTMIQIYNQQPIAASRAFMTQTKNLGVPVFEAYIRENKTMFSDAPQDAIPVVLNPYSSAGHQDVVKGIEDFVDEFVAALQL